MIEIWMHYRSRLLADIGLLAAAILPASIAVYLDVRAVTTDAFVRMGAIMALFAAFLEFRTHEVQALRERDNIHRLWATISVLTEGLANVDRAAKHALRELATVIQWGGGEPAMGKPEDIRNMVVTERIKALQRLPLVPESYYTYSKYMAFLGKALVVMGTLIWAFGDIAIHLIKK